MYKRTKQYVKSNNLEMDIFIEGDDVCNSELLYKLDQETDYQKYQITEYEHRADLISIKLYGDAKYSWVILYVNRVTLDDLVRGVELKYIPKSRLDYIINSV